MKGLAIRYCVLVVKESSMNPKSVVGKNLSRKEATILSKAFIVKGMVNKVVRVIC